jgi:hypothetical protein
MGPAAREKLLHRYGAFVRELGGRFWTGADAGTSAEDMDVIAEPEPPTFSAGRRARQRQARPAALGVEAGRGACVRCAAASRAASGPARQRGRP